MIHIRATIAITVATASIATAAAGQTSAECLMAPPRVAMTLPANPRTGTLTLEWTQSRRLAREIAAAYRAPIDDRKDPFLREARQAAAGAPESVADRRCRVPQENPR